MKLVVDTNILVSFFRANPVHEIITESKSFNLSLYSPQHAIDELKKESVKQDILIYSGLSLKRFNEEVSKLKTIIQIIPNKFFIDYQSEAKKLIHEKDVPFFALALKLNCPIWSNEPRFKKQSKVDVLSNREIIELFDSFV